MNQETQTKEQKQKQELIVRIDKLMLNLSNEKAKLEKSLLPLSEQVSQWTWVIQIEKGRYFQVNQRSINLISLKRYEGCNNILVSDVVFNSDFRLAEPSEIEAHIRFLKSKGRTYIDTTIGYVSSGSTTIQKPVTPRIPYKLSEYVKENDWVIEKSSNTYYQFLRSTSNKSGVTIFRHNIVTTEATFKFNERFRMASHVELTQHEAFLKRTGKRFTPRTKTHPILDLNLPNRDSVAFTQKSLIGWMKDQGKTSQIPLLKPKFDTTKCDFYMITCKDITGSVVRHTSYESAEQEAVRIAKKENHKTWILGVVASVEPTVTTKTYKHENT